MSSETPGPVAIRTRRSDGAADELAGVKQWSVLAEADPHFEVFMTVDQNLIHQQNFSSLRIAVIVLRCRSNKIEDISPLVPGMVAALGTIKKGEVVTLST